MNSTLELTFPVQSFRRIPNPYLKSEDGERDAFMYIAVCDVKDLPENIPMDTNPRKQKLTTDVAKKIKMSLLNTGEANFYLLNRGILLSAKSVSYNNYSNEMTVVFEDLEVHGNVDGGHTYKIILDNRDQLDKGQQYVKIEILTGIEGIFQDLAAARNWSVPVKDKSLAELANRFDIIKTTLAGEPYIDKISFVENDSGEIDVDDMLAVLTMFHIGRYAGKDSCPIIAYSSKKRCETIYIEEHKLHGESPSNPYVKMKPIMADIFKLYDAIEVSMRRYYAQKNPGGKYGRIKGVTVAKDGKQFQSKYFGKNMEVLTPNGFIYPILGAFRALVKEENGVYGWKKNPFSVLEELGPELVESTVSMSRALGNNPQSVGKNTNIWMQLYMLVAFAAIE